MENLSEGQSGYRKVVVEVLLADDFYGPLSPEQEERVAAARQQYQKTGKVPVPEFKHEKWANQEQGAMGAKVGATTHMGQTG